MNARVAASALLREQFRVRVLPLRFASSLADIGRPSAGKLWAMVRTTFSLIGILVKDRPDLAYFTLSPSGWALARDMVFLAALKIARVRVVVHLHGRGLGAAAHGNPVRRLVQAWLRDSTVIHLSPRLAAELSELVPPSHIRILPNGIDDISGGVRASHKPPTGACPRVLYFSNMLEEKGPLLLLQSLARLRARGIPFEAIFAGAAPTMGLISRFEAERKAQCLEGCAMWIGACHGESKRNAFSRAAIFAFPSYYRAEALPLVIIEAMSFGLPIVASSLGGIPDLVQDGVNGFLVEPGDVSAMSERLAMLLQDPNLRSRMGRAARDLYERKYRFEQFEESLVGILGEGAANAAS